MHFFQKASCADHDFLSKGKVDYACSVIATSSEKTMDSAQANLPRKNITSNLIESSHNSLLTNHRMENVTFRSRPAVTHPIRKQGLSGKTAPLPSLLALYNQLINIDLSTQADSTLLHWAVSSKNHSMALQQFIFQSWNGQFPSLPRCVLENLSWLIVHPWGSYVVKQLARVDPSFMRGLESYCRENFAILSANQYSSRVLEAVVCNSESFRVFVCNKLNLNPGRIVAEPPVFFIAKSLILCSKKGTDFPFIWELLQGAKLQCNSFHCMKKLMIFYTQIAPEKSLTAIADILKLRKHLRSGLNDRLLTQVTCELILRGHLQTIQSAAAEIRNNPRKLVRNGNNPLLGSKERSERLSFGNVCSQHSMARLSGLTNLGLISYALQNSKF